MSDNSYTLPPLTGQSSDSAPTGSAQSGSNTATQVAAPVVVVQGPSTKDYVFGGVILLIAAILYFFAAQQFSNYLVRKKRKPSSANNAAIWLFLFLFDITVLVVIGIFDAGILSLLQVSIPLALLAVVFFVFVVLMARR